MGRGLQDRTLVILEVVIGFAVVAAIMGKTYGTAPTVIFLLCGTAATYTGYNMFRVVASLRDPTLELQGRTRDESRESLEYEKKLLLQGIKELEIDYGVGKVDQRDYAMLRRTAEERAVKIIAQLREDDTKWSDEAQKYVQARIPGLVPAGPATAPVKGAVDDRPPAVWKTTEDGLICSACGTVNEADGRYCVGCGRPRAETPT